MVDYETTYKLVSGDGFTEHGAPAGGVYGVCMCGVVWCRTSTLCPLFVVKYMALMSDKSDVLGW